MATKTASKKQASILTMWSRWRRVRNVAASKGVTDFEQDFTAYAACVKGDRKALNSITKERMKLAGLAKTPKLSESKFQALQKAYMRLLDAR